MKLSIGLIRWLWRKLTIYNLLLFGFFLAFVVLRFYQLEERLPFGWDQVQNSWVIKNMIIDHRLPLEGMVAKGNTGFYIGPAYYYLLAPFYYIFRLDPIAAGVFAGVVSIATFFTLYFVIKKLFSAPIAAIAVGIYSVSANAITMDRIPWPVIFIPLVSLLVFYFLYRVVTGKSHYLLALALILGFSFNVHFTSVFYLMIILLTLPFIVTQRDAWKYGLLAIPLFAVWFIPNMLASSSNGFITVSNLANYIRTYYHGFHLTRLMQLLPDAVIEFETLLFFKTLKPLAVIFLPVFIWLYYQEKASKKRKLFGYLSLLWFIVPWVVFSTYSGEISNYYFILTRPLVIIILAYLTYRLLKSRLIFLKMLMLGFWIYYASSNLQSFFNNKYIVLPKIRISVDQALKEGRVINFADGDPQAYLYYIQKLKNK